MTPSEHDSPQYGRDASRARGKAPEAEVVPTLSVVVPVFNQASSIVDNLEVIRQRVLERPRRQLRDRRRLGRFDRRDRGRAASRSRGRAGSASSTTTGTSARATRSSSARWRRSASGSGSSTPTSTSIPADLATYVRRAQEQGLDFAIGSKRHPDSQVHYPRSRVVASWLFQQLVRLLFRLDVTRHAGRAEGLPPRGRRAGAAAAARQALRVRHRAARRRARVRVRSHRGDADPPRLSLHGLGSPVACRAACAGRHGRDLLPAADPPLLPAAPRDRRGATGGRGRGAYSPARVGARSAGRPFSRGRLPERRGDERSPDGLARGVALCRRSGPRRGGRGARARRPCSGATGSPSTVPFLARAELDGRGLAQGRAARWRPSWNARPRPSTSRGSAPGFGYFRFTPGNVRFVDDFPAASFVVRRDALPRACPRAARPRTSSRRSPKRPGVCCTRPSP